VIYEKKSAAFQTAEDATLPLVQTVHEDEAHGTALAASKTILCVLGFAAPLLQCGAC
jgi:hypothetical protein